MDMGGEAGDHHDADGADHHHQPHGGPATAGSSRE
jgi:hypothetical protein